LGGAAHDIAVQVEKFGHLYGEMIQIHDDLNDTMETPANPDWTQGRAPLPILFAQVVGHPDRERFLKLKDSISVPDILAEAQMILIRCGAVSYCIDQLLRRVQAAREILDNISLACPEKLEGLLDDVVNPVMNLFMEIGIEQPEAFLQPIE
jgi:geranylgeranyl pyrophosphate synthase